jgi:ribonuclease HI
MINRNMEIVMKQHEIVIKQDQSITAVYTDRSGINSRVGAAAVCPQYNETRSVYMGKQSKATVYAAKLQGILLGLIIILRCQIQHTIIFTDNQAALQAL